MSDMKDMEKDEINKDLAKTLSKIMEGNLQEVLNDAGKGVTNMDNLLDGEEEKFSEDFLTLQE